MSAVLVAITVYLAVPLAVAVGGTAINLVIRGVRPPWSREWLSAILREWMAMALVPWLLLLGALELPPARATPTSGLRHPPVILVPGYGLNRGTFIFLAIYLRRRGWPWVWGLNNRPHSASVETYVDRLAQRVQQVLAATGATRVDLVGHSMGGAIAALYIHERGGAEHVRRLVTLGTPWRGTAIHVLGMRRQARDLAPDSSVIARIQHVEVPITGVWSPDDFIVIPVQNAVPPQGRAVEIASTGHLQMLLSARVFRAVAAALASPDDGCDP